MLALCIVRHTAATNNSTRRQESADKVIEPLKYQNPSGRQPGDLKHSATARCTILEAAYLAAS